MKRSVAFKAKSSRATDEKESDNEDSDSDNEDEMALFVKKLNRMMSKRKK